MKEVKFDLEVITPMLLHGADGKTAEIRAPSIKGLMRYWWRAVKAEDNIGRLKEDEEQIFGSTKIRSKVQIRILQGNSNKKSALGFDQNKIGLNYLFPSIFVSRVRDGDPKEYFDVGTEFSIILSSLDSDSEQLKQAIASLWLMIYFGGLGSRSRRGGGNLAVKQIKNNLNLNLKFVPDNIRSEADLSNWIKSNYDEICKTINPSQGSKKYSNLRGARIKILSAYRNWQDSLNEVGKLYKDYRRDYDLVERAAIGLPLKNLDIDGKFERSASRLIIKVIKANDNYYSVIILLKGPLLTKEHGLKFRDKRYKLPDDSIIEEFFNRFKSKYDEVQL